MNKKEYMKPQMILVDVEANTMLAGSTRAFSVNEEGVDGTSGTNKDGETVGEDRWGVAW